MGKGPSRSGTASLIAGPIYAQASLPLDQLQPSGRLVSSWCRRPQHAVSPGLPDTAPGRLGIANGIAKPVDFRRPRPTVPVRLRLQSTLVGCWQETPKPRAVGSNPTAPANFPGMRVAARPVSFTN
jgi:hypothetical protein